MKNRDLKISIVIPAYNEQDHIAACLKAISRLEVKPFEVIVVDNLSTDNTAKVVEQFPFVTLVRESKQGLVYARDCGFNEARGDIIGRIDADTIVSPNWTAKVCEIFQDDSIQAVSGGLHVYDIGLSRLIDRVDAYWRDWMARRMALNSRIFLYGSNMAIRRSAWQSVRANVCRLKGLHEDLDLAIHLSEARQKVVFEPELIVNVSIRRIDCGFIGLVKYSLECPMTYIRHDAKEHRYMYPIIVIVLANYLWLRLVFRAFDVQAQRLSLKTLLLSQSATRVNPADFIQS